MASEDTEAQDQGDHQDSTIHFLLALCVTTLISRSVWRAAFSTAESAALGTCSVTGQASAAAQSPAPGLHQQQQQQQQQQPTQHDGECGAAGPATARSTFPCLFLASSSWCVR